MTPPDTEKATPTPGNCEDLPLGLRFCPMAIAGYVQQPHRKYVELSPHVRKTLEDTQAELSRLQYIEAAAREAKSMLAYYTSRPVHQRDDHNPQCAVCAAYEVLKGALSGGSQ